MLTMEREVCSPPCFSQVAAPLPISVAKLCNAFVQIQDLNNAVRQLRAEKDQLQEQLAVEKRVNSENSAKLETKPTTLSMHGLHDYDPIDMSFLPQWEGLSLSNDKIRAMPSDTLKILIQTILQDLRTRLANMDASMSPAVGHSVTQAFSFLNRWCAFHKPCTI
jgi:hypothetical protein